MADSGGGVTGIVKGWTAGLIMLGFGYLVLTHGAAVTSGLKAAGGFFSSTEGTVLRGGA
jgi:hypothetical protein